MALPSIQHAGRCELFHYWIHALKGRRRTFVGGVVIDDAEQAQDRASNGVASVPVLCDVREGPPVLRQWDLIRGPPHPVSMPEWNIKGSRKDFHDDLFMTWNAAAAAGLHADPVWLLVLLEVAQGRKQAHLCAL